MLTIWTFFVLLTLTAAEMPERLTMKYLKKLLLFPMFLMLGAGAGDGADEGGSGGDADPDPEDKNTADDGSGDTPDDGEVEKLSKKQQDMVDGLAAKARKDGRQAALNTVAEDLGMSVEDAKKIMAAAEEKRKAELSEIEKATEDAEKGKQEAEQIKLEASEQLKKANTRYMKAAVTAEAAKSDYKINPEAIEDIWVFVQSEQLEKLAIDEDDKVSGVSEAIKAVIEAHSYVVSTQRPPGTPRPNTKTKPTSIKGQKKPRRSGI